MIDILFGHIKVLQVPRITFNLSFICNRGEKILLPHPLSPRRSFQQLPHVWSPMAPNCKLIHPHIRIPVHPPHFPTGPPTPP